MAIHRLLQGSNLGMNDIEQIAAAYERTLRALSLKDRNDPTAEKCGSLPSRQTRSVCAEITKKSLERDGDQTRSHRVLAAVD